MKRLVLFFAVVALAAASFWELKPVHVWNSQEVARFLSSSPWARPLVADLRLANTGLVPAYLASAEIVQSAERRRQQLSKTTADPDAASLAADYRDYLAERKGRIIVLAIPVQNLEPFSEGETLEDMRKESIMKIRGKKYSVELDFPPTPSDPVLRLVFPRPPGDLGNRISFELYLPGFAGSYRTVEFDVAPLVRNGRADI